jgi:hypothetical protein
MIAFSVDLSNRIAACAIGRAVLVDEGDRLL